MKLELATFLTKALEKIPGETDLVFLNNVIRDGARKNDRRPAYLTAFVPDEWTLNIFGSPNLRDMFIAVRIPIEFVDELRKKWSEENNKVVPEDQSSIPEPTLESSLVDSN